MRYLINKSVDALLQIKVDVISEILFNEISSMSSIVQHYTIDCYLKLGDYGLIFFDS